MKKIPSIFVRDWNGDRSRVLNEINPECRWVFDGDGVATRKWDGTACMIKDHTMYLRFDYKKKSREKGNAPPAGWKPCQPEYDETTGHWPGWVPVVGAPNNKQHMLIVYDAQFLLPDGTYELCGPKIGVNAEGFDELMMMRHGEEIVSLQFKQRTFNQIRGFLVEHEMEGIVFYHRDGRMAKIKAKDFGIAWPREANDRTTDVSEGGIR